MSKRIQLLVGGIGLGAVLTLLVVWAALQMLRGNNEGVPIMGAPAGIATVPTGAATAALAGPTSSAESEALEAWRRMGGDERTSPFTDGEEDGIDLDVALEPYSDATGYFSLEKPTAWQVSIGEAILVTDPADGGATEVRIQPIHLSGVYRSISARDLANYIVGKLANELAGFKLDAVREAGDDRLLELVVGLTKDGAAERGVITVFVNTPYALVSSYATRAEVFDAKEPLLRAVLASYRQSTPPAGASGQEEADREAGGLGPLHDTTQDGGVHIALPDGWSVQVFPGCAGLIAQDAANPARNVIMMSGLHQSVAPLPSGVTPETYISGYLAQDFKTVSEVRLLGYEDIDVSALSAGGSVNVKSMRVSFSNQGVPALGSFTVGTYQTGISTAVAYLWAISGPADTYLAEAPTLVESFQSIDYAESTLGQCRQTLNRAWQGARKVGETLAGSLEENQRAWEDRQARNDEIIEKFSDAILDRDRVYNPENDEVYEVSPEFYNYYDSHREEFKYQDMRELQPGEWLKYAPLDGRLHVQ